MLPFTATRINPEIIILTEVRERRILYGIIGRIEKLIQMSLCTKQTQTHRHRREAHGSQGEKRGEEGGARSVG